MHLEGRANGAMLDAKGRIDASRGKQSVSIFHGGRPPNGCSPVAGARPRHGHAFGLRRARFLVRRLLAAGRGWGAAGRRRRARQAHFRALLANRGARLFDGRPRSNHHRHPRGEFSDRSCLRAHAARPFARANRQILSFRPFRPGQIPHRDRPCGAGARDANRDAADRQGRRSRAAANRIVALRRGGVP